MAFVPGDRLCIPGAADGPLRGLSFGVKDLYDVAGHVTGAGNPDWLATHPPAERTASVVEALLAAGASLAGKTITDELAYSLSGENAWYGTPPNPAAPDRIPGGSSSGSASAVAAGLVDFALGTDTGGSVRIPASFCGIYGLRTTHGVISREGLVPLAPSFDTVGWFARSAEMLERVGNVLLPSGTHSEQEFRTLQARDAYERSDPCARQALALSATEITLGPLSAWADCFTTLQAREVWQCHGEWIRQVSPRFGPGVKERFERASRVTDVSDALPLRAEVTTHLHALLDGAILLLPTAPGAAPRRGAPLEESDRFRRQCLELLCAAGLAGLPQLSLPLGRSEGCPLGISLLGGPGSDRALLSLARALEAAGSPGP